MPAVFALVTLTVLMPVVSGDLDCPSPSLVAQRLAELGNTGEVSSETVELSRENGAVVVRLRRDDGEILGTRRLAQGSCLELAESAAVVLALLRAESAAAQPASIPQAPWDRRRSWTCRLKPARRLRIRTRPSACRLQPACILL